MKHKAQAGASAVEFALVLPILLLLVFAIFELGLLLYNKAVITNASREAARYGVVMRTPKHTSGEIEQKALDYCSDFLVSLSPSTTLDPNLEVTVPIPGAGGSFGQPLTVTVSYTFTGLGLGTLLSPLTGPITLTATTVMNNE